jgi:hypothetical protein
MTPELIEARLRLRDALLRREEARIDLIVAARAVRAALDTGPKTPALLRRQAD